MPAPADAWDVVTVEVRVDGDEHGEVLVLHADTFADPHAAVLEIVADVAGGRTVDLAARVTGDANQQPVACPAVTLWSDVTLWWLPSDPTGLTGDPATWPGAVPLGTRTIVPELDTSTGSQQWPVPDGPGFLFALAVPWNRYDVFTSGMTWVVPVPAGSDAVQATADVAVACQAP